MIGMIVVGVDGSESARAALGWAFAEARLRNTALQVVSAWSVPTQIYGASLAPIDLTPPEVFESAAQRAIADTVDALGTAADGLAVERLVVEGGASQVLVEAAKGAELLVVGSRGHGGFGGLLLGSVSQQCAQHATCPVVIVRHDAQASSPS